jgi:hypothetical protein
MVNVELAAEWTENLPLIPFSDFERARSSDKLFPYGPSGCGKSRATFELVRENLSCNAKLAIKIGVIVFVKPLLMVVIIIIAKLLMLLLLFLSSMFVYLHHMAGSSI